MGTTGTMVPIGSVETHVLQAELADPQFRLLPVFIGVRREVPGVNLIMSELDAGDVFHLGDLRMNAICY